MRNARLVLLLAFGVAVAAGLYAAEKTVTLEGTLVDSKCYLKDNANIGNDHGGMPECGTMCLKGGTPGGLVTANKKYHPIIASSHVLAPHVGQTIRVVGTLNGTAILPEKVEVKKEGKWEEVKLGTMM